MLTLETNGILANISESYFDSSRCAVPEHEEISPSSINLTLVDMGGVFLILTMFVAVSLVSWACRRSPPAKTFWKRRRRASEKVLKVARVGHINI